MDGVYFGKLSNDIDLQSSLLSSTHLTIISEPLDEPFKFSITSTMKRKSWFTMIIFIFLIVSAVGLQSNYTEISGSAAEESSEKGRHVLSKYWPLHSLTGLLGSFLNMFVLYIFISDRETLTTSINSMIW